MVVARSLQVLTDSSSSPRIIDSWIAGMEERGMQGMEVMSGGEIARYSDDSVARDSEVEGIADSHCESQGITDSLMQLAD